MRAIDLVWEWLYDGVVDSRSRLCPAIDVQLQRGEVVVCRERCCLRTSCLAAPTSASTPTTSTSTGSVLVVSSRRWLGFPVRLGWRRLQLLWWLFWSSLAVRLG